MPGADGDIGVATIWICCFTNVAIPIAQRWRSHNRHKTLFVSALYLTQNSCIKETKPAYLSVYNFGAELEIFTINLVDFMTDDNLTPFVAKASAALLLDKSDIVFHEETLPPDTSNKRKAKYIDQY